VPNTFSPNTELRVHQRIHRVGQNRIYTPYKTVNFVISLPKIPYIHRIYMVLANPTHTPHSTPHYTTTHPSVASLHMRIHTQKCMCIHVWVLTLCKLLFIFISVCVVAHRPPELSTSLTRQQQNSNAAHQNSTRAHHVSSKTAHAHRVSASEIAMPPTEQDFRLQTHRYQG
jgi:hypothetical protein